MGLLFFLLLGIVALVVIGGALMGLVWQLFVWALIGLVIGFIARAVLSGPRSVGTLQTILAGIGGSLLGGVIANGLDVGRVLQFLIAVLVAAILVLVFERSSAGKRR